MSQIPNPFAQSVAPNSVDPPMRWDLASDSTPLNPAEVESADSAVEVVILWGDDVLHVEYVSPPRDIILGEAFGSDCLLGADALGTTRLPVVVERGGTLSCVLPEGARGSVAVGDRTKTFAELEAEGALLPYDELQGTRLYPLPDAASARIDHRGFAFLVRPTRAGRSLGRAALVPWRRYEWVGLSLAVHACFLLMFYFLPPSSRALSLNQITAADRMVEYLDPTRESVQKEPVAWEGAASEPAGGTGERAAEEEGQSGDQEAEVTRHRYAVPGDRADPNPEMAREQAQEMAQAVGAIGAVRSLLGTWNAPTSPYGADQAHGNDAMAAIGALMGDQVGANFGFMARPSHGWCSCPDLRRTYEVGRLGTVGISGGNGPGQGYGPGGYGGGVQIKDRPHRDRVPRIRETGGEVRGSLSAEAIRRVVRRHLPEVRFCYEQGLQQNPSIEGRVVVSWIIGASGAVQSSVVQGSSLGNDRVESCIAGAVRRWTFPQPDGGGVVGVNYPFVLQMH